MSVKALFILPLLVFGAYTAAKPLNNSAEIEGRSAGNETDDLIDLTRYGGAIFGEPDYETGHYLMQYAAQATQNPEELGSYLEGDILMPQGSYPPYRNGMLIRSARWPGAIVPYEIRGRFNGQDMAILNNAFKEYHTRTCIRFKPRTTERDYIAIMNNATGCWSSMGRLGGRQVVNLQSPVCMRTYGTAIHELMHALGFFHEQNRHERDNYIKVLTENVKPAMLINFKKATSREQYGYGVAYDYASVMHYSPTGFSMNGQPTIMALRKTPEARMMGQRNGFSKGDVQKINAMYRCKVRAPSPRAA